MTRWPLHRLPRLTRGRLILPVIETLPPPVLAHPVLGTDAIILPARLAPASWRGRQAIRRGLGRNETGYMKGHRP